MPLAIRTPERLRSPPDITLALRTFPGNIPGTDKVTGIDSACKDRIRGCPRRSEKPNTLYTGSKYEMIK
jgi:hypothetical protein